MKIRIGFVSNSSSSSFILVTEKDIQHAKTLGIKYYDINAILNDIDDKIVQIKKLSFKEDVVPTYMNEHYLYAWDIGFMIAQLENLKKSLSAHKNQFITEAVDRDFAYEQGFHMHVFDTDL